MKEQILMHRWRYPSLSLHGIEGAFSDGGAKTVIPRKVIGKFSIRLVPDMDPKVVEKQVANHIQEALWRPRFESNLLGIAYCPISWEEGEWNVCHSHSLSTPFPLSSLHLPEWHKRLFKYLYKYIYLKCHKNYTKTRVSAGNIYYAMFFYAMKNSIIYQYNKILH